MIPSFGQYCQILMYFCYFANMINAVSLQQKTKKKIKMKTNNLSGLIRTHKMGNITNVKIIVMALALGFAFTACAGNSNKTESKKENKSEINKTKGEKKMNVTELNKADFLQKVYNFEANPKEWKFEGDKPAIVDFFATWCGPCRGLAPIMDELAGEYSGKIDFYKIDVDKQEELAAAFGVQSIPTLLFIPKNGQPKMMQGALPKNELVNIINKDLLGK